MEDDEHLARLMRAALVQQGFKVTVTGDSAAAIEQARALTPPLILLDVNVPGSDGFDVCRTVRASEPENQRSTIVMITAQDEVASKLRAFAAGADDYLVKPVDVRELATRASLWLGTRALQEDLVKRRRREAIHEIVVSICHEINNPLTAAMMALELVIEHSSSCEETDAHLAMIREQLDRLSGVIVALRSADDSTVSYLGSHKMIDLRRSSEPHG
jgi:DNA-binding response OmpR family regulator